ncbi:uncharacterized protein LOC135930565 isoform X2 [Gordionus sp. m RMFG-2023]|uniref:uncharacterized protein LOC135930565 isoform X2 n=1 Tax=Gordionus sp. m RMFG-2023 TaxID=3053472 RepID=UPI0031FE020D
MEPSKYVDTVSIDTIDKLKDVHAHNPIPAPNDNNLTIEKEQNISKLNQHVTTEESLVKCTIKSVNQIDENLNVEKVDKKLNTKTPYKSLLSLVPEASKINTSNDKLKNRQGEMEELNVSSDHVMEDGEASEDDLNKFEKINDIGIGLFMDNFKQDLEVHVKTDKELQKLDIIAKLRDETFNLDEEKEKKNVILNQLTRESYENMGNDLPSDFISKKHQKQKLNEDKKKPKNVLRIQKYYGDLYEHHENGGGDSFNPISNKMSSAIPELAKDLGKNEFYCQLCNVRMNGTQSFEAHTKGSKHFKKMKKTKENNLVMAAQLPCIDFPIYPDRKGSSLDKKSSATKCLLTLEPKKEMELNIEAKLILIEKPLIGLQFVVEYFYEGDKTSEPKYFCELCDKKCDLRTLEFHVIGYSHRWSYIKLKHPYYANEIREYGSRKQDRTDAIEEYSNRIEAEEGFSRKIKKSMTVSNTKILTIEDAMHSDLASSKTVDKIVKSQNDKKSDGSSHQLDLVNDFLNKASHSRPVDISFNHTSNYRDINITRIPSPVRKKTIFAPEDQQHSRHPHPKVANSWQVITANKHILPQLPLIKLPSNHESAPLMSEEMADEQEFREFILYKRLKRKFDSEAGQSINIPPTNNYVQTDPNININRIDHSYSPNNNEHPENESSNNFRNINSLNQANDAMRQLISKMEGNHNRDGNLRAAEEFIYNPRPNLNSFSSKDYPVPARHIDHSLGLDRNYRQPLPQPLLQMIPPNPNIPNLNANNNNRFMRDMMDNIMNSIKKKKHFNPLSNQVSNMYSANENFGGNRITQLAPLFPNHNNPANRNRNEMNQKIDNCIRTLIKKGGPSRR